MHFHVELELAAMDKSSQTDTKSKPGAVATGRRLKFSKTSNACIHFTLESLAGRYGSRFGSGLIEVAGKIDTN
jgi:hypothetical protein